MSEAKTCEERGRDCVAGNTEPGHLLERNTIAVDR